MSASWSHTLQRARSVAEQMPMMGRPTAPSIGCAPMTAFERRRELDTVTLWRAGAAARLELNRPQALNAWNRRLGIDLLEAVRSLAEDDEVRAALVTGAGRAFSSGADLKDLSAQEELTPEG